MSTTYQRSVPDPPLHEQQWNEPQSELSESTLRGSPNLPDHPKENPLRRVGPTSESPRSGWRCGPSTTQHRLTRPSPQGCTARECDVTMSFHGSRSRGQRVRALYPHSTTLGPSRVHAPSYRLGIGDPIPLPLKHRIR